MIWRLHVRDSIGRRRLVDLTPWDFECYFRQLKAAGQSQSSVRYARTAAPGVPVGPQVEQRGATQSGG